VSNASTPRSIHLAYAYQSLFFYFPIFPKTQSLFVHVLRLATPPPFFERPVSRPGKLFFPPISSGLYCTPTFTHVTICHSNALNFLSCSDFFCVDLSSVLFISRISSARRPPFFPHTYILSRVGHSFLGSLAHSSPHPSDSYDRQFSSRIIFGPSGLHLFPALLPFFPPFLLFPPLFPFPFSFDLKLDCRRFIPPPLPYYIAAC